MSARDKILNYLWMAVPSSDDAEARALAEQMVDDYAHELAEEIRNYYASGAPCCEACADGIDPEVGK